METTLFYARAACDTMMRKFAAADLPPKGHYQIIVKSFFITSNEVVAIYAAVSQRLLSV